MASRRDVEVEAAGTRTPAAAPSRTDPPCFCQPGPVTSADSCIQLHWLLRPDPIPSSLSIQVQATPIILSEKSPSHSKGLGGSLFVARTGGE